MEKVWPWMHLLKDSLDETIIVPPTVERTWRKADAEDITTSSLYNGAGYMWTSHTFRS